MLNELYTRVSSAAKQLLYQYMKDNDISLLDYHFSSFFHYFTEKNEIRVISHHFSNHKIEGLTVIDNMGISFSYERDNPIVKQNFTLCHELGHFLLEHEGNYFTESVDIQENILEREANLFSAVILMPDIVLLSKIYYKYDSFHQVQEDLGVSKKALSFRLLDLLRAYSYRKEVQIKKAIDEYIENQNASIHLLFHNIKEDIINEFNQYKPSLKNQIQNNISREGFISSQKLPELLNQENWPFLKENIENLKIWLVYNKGKKVAYAWNSLIFTDDQARKKAELQLLIM